MSEIIEKEVRDFISLFDAWVSGRAIFDWDVTLVARLDLNGAYVTRGGVVQTLGEMSAEVKRARGANPDYRVEAGSVRVVAAFSGRYVVLYEEHTTGSRLSQSSEFVRMVTAVLHTDAVAPGGFRWSHIHESQRDI